MRKLVVKSGIKQLPLFKGEKFSYLEAYVAPSDRLEKFLETSMKLVSIHMPSVIEIDGKIKPLNFCDSEEIGSRSFKKLREIVDFSNTHGVQFIIIHLGVFNIFNQNRNKIIDELTDKLNNIEIGAVKMCIENVPCWTNLSFANEPIISDEKHMLYLKERSPQIGFVLDVDHVAVNTIFQHFYEGFKKEYSAAIDRQKFKEQMEEEITNITAKDPSYFKHAISKAIADFLSVIQPNLVHAAGSDFCNYRLMDKLPLVGEALPLGYKGKIEGIYVEDRLDHHAWLSLLSDQTFITLELMFRKEYSYIDQIKKSQQFLKDLLEEGK